MKQIFNRAAEACDKLVEKICKGKDAELIQTLAQAVVVLPILGVAALASSPALALFGGLVGGGYAGAVLGRQLHEHYNCRPM